MTEIDPFALFNPDLLKAPWKEGEFSGSGEPCVIPERMIALNHPKAHRLVTGMLLKYGLLTHYVRRGCVLDLCCGAAFGASYLAQQGYHVTAVDSTAETLGWAQHREGIQIIHSNIMRERYGTFNAVTLVDALEHFLQEDQPKVMNVIFDHLQPGGIALIDTPLVRTSHRQSSKHRWVLSWDDLAKLAEDAGLEIVGRYTLATFRDEYPVLLRVLPNEVPAVHENSDQILIARRRYDPRPDTDDLVPIV